MKCLIGWGRPSQSSQRVETSDTSGDETDASQGHRKVLSKKIFRMKKVYAATELGRFFVTGPSDAAKMPSHFYCRLCRNNVSVLTNGHHEVLRHFQGRRHFARDQRLRLETPGWRVLDFQGNHLSEDELERQRENVQKGPLVVRDRELPFAEDLITDEAGVVDAQLPVLAKVSCLVDAMKMGFSYGLVEKLWPQFVLTAVPVNREVAWTRDEVLVGSVDFRNPFVSCLIHIVVLLFVYHYYWNVALNFVASGWLGKSSSFLQPWVRGAWRVIVGLRADVGEGHFPSGCCECCRPFCSWCHTRAICVRVSCVCSGWFIVPGCCFWWVVACVGRHVQGIFGKWELAHVSGVSHFWSKSPEAMFEESVVFHLWVFGSLLDDGIYCHASEECRTLRLDDVPVQSPPCHHHRRAVVAISCWGHQQHRGGVASHRGVPQRDWSQNWRRQLSGIIHCALFSSYVILPSSSCFFSFRRRESMAIFTSVRWPEASSACSIWCLRYVGPASCTFLMWFTLVRIHTEKVVRTF